MREYSMEDGDDEILSPTSTDAHAHIGTAQAYLDPYRQPSSFSTPPNQVSTAGRQQRSSVPTSAYASSNTTTTASRTAPHTAGPISPGLRSAVSGFFNFGSGPDLALALGRKQNQNTAAEARSNVAESGSVSSAAGSGLGDKRGGAHRGVKDYPHRRKGEEETEREERKGLVADADAEGEGEGDEDDEKAGMVEEVDAGERYRGAANRSYYDQAAALGPSPYSRSPMTTPMSEGPDRVPQQHQQGQQGGVRRLPVIPGRNLGANI